MDINIIKEVREKQPLVHHITNEVVMNFSANGLLAFGGSPIMAHAEEEVEDVSRLADGVLLNIGTLTEKQVNAMITAGQAANEAGVPVVVDPVGAPATKFRSKSIQTILERVKPSLIKGNAGELAHLIGEEVETKGVESTGTGNEKSIAERVAQTYETTAVVTGKMDVVSDGTETRTNSTGHPLLAKVTGTGCLLGSILAACMSATGSSVTKIHTALEFFGAAAEYAASQEEVQGSGTFTPRFLDALAMDPDQWRGDEQ
ncbi:hydroxyethylthiazole kinase [Halobacillus halophilus]|uniref:Hydroxyethylthiazole kinase n=1 Tax=Halobacillus halophilus (strain ATCC 35676 / DSM 2266 / JCM 20832 / KCTC 3685 / LMG 17431 / NBRC 102448 / NCIMB 2269) TaxID=866895 RepID=I0JSY8_HALH3|nr:hydroxyethylthiazole kinase [Halobacillus halophilus]ASF41181.1 hydroxyethylthiazole kinase [Halobacillus halophilus]CCG47260.1 hydroxyethylthiazole kinase [Halobacillus halophilus DSM 2266]